MREPIIFIWTGGEASVGYLGELRWRVRVNDESIDVPDVSAAVEQVFQVIFAGVSTGEEATVRGPIEINGPDNRLQLVRDERMINGWQFIGRQSEGTVGPHDQLKVFVVAHVANATDSAWAQGTQPNHPPHLGIRFAFQEFAEADDPDTLCRELAAELTRRVRAHPSADLAFTTAMLELQSAGHDLWSYDSVTWGHSYMKRHKGAGLWVQFGGDDGICIEEDTVTVEFKPPEG